MIPWCEFVVGGLLWAGIIAGLVSVVRDCMRDRRLEATFTDPEEEDGSNRCCCLGSLEILPRQREEGSKQEKGGERCTQGQSLC